MLLSYGTNVHPAEDLSGVLDQLGRYCGPVREALAVDRLGIGLWLAADVATGLATDPSARARLAAELNAHGLAVQTLNAFPYSGFHDAVVKQAVYRPDWTDPRRQQYTLDCATVLADLLPEDSSYGSISTLPLAWRSPWTADQDTQARRALEATTVALSRLPRPIRLAVEPEPGCVLDTVADAVSWLAGDVDPDVVGLCLDTCHLAVSFADPAAAVARIQAAGLRVMKIQLSAAVHVDDPGSDAARTALAGLAEPRYLHQVRERQNSGAILAADDLPEALAEAPAGGLPATGPWRVHFHVPLHQALAAPLTSTTDVLIDAVTAVLADPDANPDGPPHLEVETYTWGVLPGGGEIDLVTGIADELRWATANVAAVAIR